jgi:alginate O-acetyltransferase complex protein AlgI
VLFNSHVFIFLFLPLCLLVFAGLNQYQARYTVPWLVVCSLFFYGWWNPNYLFLLTLSIGFNFFLGQQINRAGRFRKGFLILGISVNLGLIGFFKYANFFVDNANALGANLILETVILPLAISFFTFQQIAYLVDIYRRETKPHCFSEYCLFVTFFPQLIAGPIVHQKEMLPQFRQMKINEHMDHIAIGVMIFSMGLFKKVVLADGVAVHATPVFVAAEQGVQITLLEGWAGALAYTLQLYFDFSGYSDMAVGIARMFGVILPINFYSPYRAKNIIEFWRRWHITLSRFLRDYCYIPLGGNRKGTVHRYRNLLLTMLIGGLWHGAGWTFVFWGGLHGLYLIVNHAWHALQRVWSIRLGFFGRFLSYLLTFVAVVVAWVFFRAESIDGALLILQGMCGLHGVLVSATVFPWFVDSLEWLGFVVQIDPMSTRYVDKDALKWIACLLLIVFFLPNVYSLFRQYQPALNIEAFSQSHGSKIVTINRKWVVISALAFIISILYLTRISEFLYFQF